MITDATPEVDPLTASQLLGGFDSEQRAAFMDLSTIVAVEEPGAQIVREGEPAENFYFILDGEVEVLKREPKSSRELQLTTLGPGDHFGESSLLREGSRTATVRTLTPVVMVMVHARKVREAPHEHNWLTPLLLGLDRMSHQIVDGLRHQLDEARHRSALQRSLLFVILALSLYALSVTVVRELGGSSLLRATLTRGLDLGLAASLIAVIRTGPIEDLSFYGLRIAEDWKRELLELSLTTAACITTLSGLAFLVLTSMAGAGAPPVELFRTSDDLFVEVVYLFGVAVLVGIEELCVRGVLQSTLHQLFASDPRRILFSIVLSNALFAAVHTPISANYALVQFALGLIWGFVYSRHRSLLGVTISHIVVAYFALRVLHLDELLAAAS